MGAALLAFAAEIGEGLFAVDRLHPTTLQIVVPLVERVAKLDHFFEISGHRVFDQIVGRATAFACQLLQAGFGFRTEVDFHGFKSSRWARLVKRAGPRELHAKV